MIGLVVRLGIDARDMNDEIAYSARITPFIVVPSDQLDKVRVKLYSRLSVEDGGECAPNPIARDNLVLGDSHDSFVFFASCSFFECFCDIGVSSAFLEAYHEINDRNIDGRNTESHTTTNSSKKIETTRKGNYRREFSGQRGDGSGDRLGGAGRSRNNVVVHATSSSPISLRRAIHSLLTGSSRMDSCHQALYDTVLVI